MPTTVEALELQVQDNAQSAVGGINALSDSLSRLKNAIKGGVGLTSTTNQLTKLSTALNSLNGTNISKLESLSRGLQSLSAVSGVKLSSSIPNNVTSLSTALRTLSKGDIQKLSMLSGGLSSLTKVGKVGITKSTIDNIERFATVSSKFKDLDFSGLTRLSQALAPLVGQFSSLNATLPRTATQLQSVTTATNSLAKANGRANTSYINLYASLRMAITGLQSISRVVAGMITKSNQYIEDMNLFDVAMGEYADEARQYAESVSEVLGIDPGEFMRNQGIFNTIITGFGVANDQAKIMSQNLTQLGYDLSSFFNISFTDSMQKLQSGISGELEPLRRLGYDLSVARLQQEALNLGIEKSVSKMTQAEKSQLRYYAIMTQVTTAQGDMARTLSAPANQLRILQAQITQCARAWGNIFIPMLNAVLPYAIALAKVLKLVGDVIAKLMGFKTTSVDFSSSGLSSGAKAVGDMADGLGDANKNAKKLKSNLLGIDELNVLNSDDDSSKGAGSNLGLSGGDLGIELPTYDFLGDAVDNRINDILEKMKEWLGLTDDINSWADLFNTRLGKILKAVMAIGLAFAAWKIAKGVSAFINSLAGLGGLGSGLSALGFLMFAADLKEFFKYFDDFVENGATFQNVVGMISEFAGMVGDALILLGNVKVGGALKVVQGIGEICVAVKDIADNGVNWDNATTAIRGLTNVAIGIGVFTGHLKVAAWGVAIQGLVTIIREIADNWEAIKQGDWSGVDKVALAIGALEVFGGLMVAFDAFGKLKGALNVGQATEAMTTVTETTTTVSTATGGLTTKLGELVKNLALGIVIIAEVAAAALIIVGAIALLGLELQAVGNAWTPVIENGANTAIALGLGTAMLVAVGVATALLGSLGTGIALQIGLGTLILIELGAATLLFIAEIWAIGKGLDKVGKAWQPVLTNGATIKTGIVTGTALLVGIGVVTALLGAATVASAGLLPIAIGLGTALLVELAAAFVLFVESLVAVADELSLNLSPALVSLNGKLPTLTTNMSNFVDFMTAFADEVVRYTKATAVSGLATTIGNIIDWFTDDPIDSLAKDVEKIKGQAEKLNEKLKVANPELKSAIDLLKKYKGFVEELGKVAGSGGTVNLTEGLKTNLKEVGEGIVTGFNEGIKAKYSEVQSTMTTWGTDNKKWFTETSFGATNKTTYQNAAKEVVTGFNTGITTNSSTSQSSMTSWAANVKKWFTDTSFGGVNKTTFEGFGKDTITGFKSGITTNYSTAKSSMNTFGSSVVTWFNKPDGKTSLKSQFTDIGSNVIQGFIDGVNSLWDTAMSKIKKFGEEVIKKGKEGTDEHSPSKAFRQIGAFVIEGFNLGLQDTMQSSFAVMREWTEGLRTYAPSLALAVDTSSLDNLNKSALSDDVYAEVQSSWQNAVTVDGFYDAMEDFYKQHVEPSIARMVSATERQADKEEQTIVQVGNRVVTDAVVTQQHANGYRFVTP